MYIPRILPLPPPAFNGGLDDNSGESANNAALLLWSWGVIKPPFGSASLISEIGVSSQVFGKIFFAFSFGNNQHQVKKKIFPWIWLDIYQQPILEGEIGTGDVTVDVCWFKKLMTPHQT